jgi:hypothetical protein
MGAPGTVDPAFPGEPVELLEPVEDRVEVFAGLDATGRADVLARVPLLAAALVGHGPAAGVLAGRRAASSAPDRLGRLFGSPVGVAVAVASCSPSAHALAQVLVWHGGTVPVAVLAREADGVDPAVIEAALDELVGSLLARRVGDAVTLRPGVAAAVPLPGLAVRHLVADPAMTNAELDEWLRSLDAPVDRTNRRTRLASLEAALRDPELVRRQLSRRSAEAQAAFVQLTAHPGGLPVSTLGCAWYAGGMTGRYLRATWVRPPTPVHELVEAGLARVDVDDQRCVVLLDAVVALAGRLHPSWPEPPVRAPAPLRSVAGLPPAPGRVQALLDRWARQPAEGLRSGGLGARALATAAKHVGIPEADGKVLGALARQLGLVRPVVRTEGTGRRAVSRTEYVPSEAAAAFAAAPFAVRWAALVEAWLDAEPAEPEVSFVRRTLVADLADLPPATGIPTDGLVAWASAHRMVFAGRPTLVADAVIGLRALGLVPDDGPVGLTDQARSLLVEPGRLRVGETAGVVVQADHTVIVPPDADPDVLARIERLAVVVSAGAARVYRLDPDRIAAAVADGDRADAVLAFLGRVAQGPLPTTVERLVTDAARSAEGLDARAAASVVVAADPAALARALGVRAAGLRAVAPTVAVSDLPLPKVLAALRAKGVHLRSGPAEAEPAAGPDPGVEPAPDDRPPRADRTGPGAVLARAVAGPLQPDRAVLAELLRKAR